jgi:hypothetical protein
MYYSLKKKGTFIMSEVSSLEKKHDGISRSVLEFRMENLVCSNLSVR